jgi:membrane protein insertase Oxa1/YidC/SpoIIIJ
VSKIESRIWWFSAFLMFALIFTPFGLTLYWLLPWTILLAWAFGRPLSDEEQKHEEKRV